MKQSSLLFFLIFFVCHYTNGQRLSITKEKLINIFEESTKGEPSNKFWTASNKENASLKFDTIAFYNNQSFQQLKNGCNYINWRYIDSITFSQNESMICAELPEETIHLNGEDLFTIKLKEKSNELYLTTFQRDRVVNRFKVIGFEEVVLDEFTGKSHKLTLLRIKKENQRLRKLKIH